MPQSLMIGLDTNVLVRFWLAHRAGFRIGLARLTPTTGVTP